MKIKKPIPAIVASLLVIQILLLGWECRRNSITWDEVAYLAAGIRHWTTGTFDLARVNPPLVRMVASLPVLPSSAKTDWLRESRRGAGRTEHAVGQDFINANGEAAFWYYTIARWACLPFAIVGGVVCSRWARELYGQRAGLLALILWCFSPTVLAHAQLITPDAGATSLGLLANYLFWRWLVARRASWKRCVFVGLALGLAELTKTTWIVLFALWPCIWAYWELSRRREDRQQTEWNRALQLATIIAVGLYVLNLGYGFEGSGRLLRDYTFGSRALSGKTLEQPGATNRFADSVLGAIPVPLPHNYVQGIDRTKFEFERGLWSYLRGEWKHGGWWYYYLYALAVKGPLGTWLLLIMAALLRPCRLHSKWRWRDEVVLLAPLAAVLVLVSSQTGFNHHMRYVMPILPYLFIWTSQVALVLRPSSPLDSSAIARAENGRRTARPQLFMSCFVTFALTWSVTSSLWIFPHTTTYFNEAAGGPWGGPMHLSDSNLDWGQDLLHLRRWLDKHSEARPLGFSYVVPLIDPRIAGIDYSPIPPGIDAEVQDSWDFSPLELGPQPGWFAISVNHIHGRAKQYKYFERFEPIATAGYSTNIYHLELDEVNKVRSDYGMPLIASLDEVAVVPGERDAVTALRPYSPIIQFAENGHVTGVKLEGRELDEDAFLSLSGLSRVKSISLFGSVFEDDALRHLTELQDLEDLGLGRTGISDAGLEHVGRIPNLLQVWLTDAPDVTSTAISDLKRAKQQLRVHK